MADEKSQKPEREKVALNARNLDRELRRRFKILCLENQIPMQDAVELLIENAVVTGKI